MPVTFVLIPITKMTHSVYSFVQGTNTRRVHVRVQDGDQGPLLQS